MPRITVVDLRLHTAVSSFFSATDRINLRTWVAVLVVLLTALGR